MAGLSIGFAFLIGLMMTFHANANPYFDEAKVPSDDSFSTPPALPDLPDAKIKYRIESGSNILRVGVKLNASEVYRVARVVRETSGTPAFIRRAKLPSRWGSYRGILHDASNGNAIAYDSIGTGKEYRRLVDELSFRFPLPERDVVFELLAENPVSGKMESVLKSTLRPNRAQAPSQLTPTGLEIREIKRPDSNQPSLRVNIYADGYLDSRREVFWSDAKRAVSSLMQNKFPMLERMHFFAIFAPSQKSLGSPTDLGMPVPERESFLGMYFPYWENFGRWFNVVYPTREHKFRSGLAVAPYDHSLVLLDDSGYWGMGNFRVTTAIPTRSSSFTYLLLHEMGHYFGLNEEYNGGGRTELEFAPGIEEPWSQNITFLRVPDLAHLKWSSFVKQQTPIPTSNGNWSGQTYGAYLGGYADSEPRNQSHKPGLSCVMEMAAHFCDVCSAGISDVLKSDLGEVR